MKRAGDTLQMLERIQALGFDTVLIESGSENRINAALARACGSRSLSLFTDLNLTELDLHHPLVSRYPECFAIRRSGDAYGFVDPRDPAPGTGYAYLREREALGPIIAWWSKLVAEWLDAGVRGFRVLKPTAVATALLDALMEFAASRGPNRVSFVADATGAPRNRVSQLKGFDFTLSSLPWWDGRANWLIEEYEALSRVAPVIAQVESPANEPPASSRQRCGRLAIAAATGTGLMLPLSYAEPASEGADTLDLNAAIRAANDFIGETQWVNGQLQAITGAGAPLTILLRADGTDIRSAKQALVAAINPNPLLAADLSPELLTGLGAFNKLDPVSALGGDGPRLKPGEVRLFRARRAPLIVSSRRDATRDVDLAVESPRLVVGNVSPAVDDGAFAAKAIVGEQISVEADIFTDGHPVIGAELQYRAKGKDEWTTTRMNLVANDRWSAAMPLEQIGAYEFAVEAWIDIYGSFVRDLMKKRDASIDLSLEILEGGQLLQAAMKQTSGACAQALRAIVRGFEALARKERAALLVAPETVETMRRADPRRFRARSKTYVVDAERQEACFSSWYELFPRSESGDPARHGTFCDVIGRLPAIREMGFDTLYFPPIHPVGLTNRKGRNNSLKAGADDPGSVYAIGSEVGGHDAVHAELGTIADFRELIAAARRNGLEIALDFAVQASPDHPWLKQHPGWFDWRPDGSIKYAENPPKKYEDIVNVDFYARDAVPALWVALRDVVLFWIGHGVKVFRVDNPHTKPFPFWQWLIADIRGEHPDVIFLSEAFTRPKVMYHLAKLGFSQSYTYFIWRNTKRELTDYMTELNSAPVAGFFRPHFFVNTPDINPFFVQNSGRAGFLIRAALAATLSGLWGMYSGFELCEAEALAGKEEYLDSEKYEIKKRDWRAPGNIVAEIAQLNRLRKAHPALQTHLGIKFYNAFNDNILYFGKTAPGHDDRILVAVSLDPHHAQEADFEIPLWEWGRADHESLECEDLLHGGHSIWRGKIQRMRLTPDMPYAIWRMQPPRDA